MAVRDVLLATLLPAPAYGFQAHGALAARTGGRRAINVGQTYATLERLTRQGLVEPAGLTDDGLPLHRLTDGGRSAALGWLAGADSAGTDPWDETVDRVLVARSLGGAILDSSAVLAAERERWVQRRAEAAAFAATGTPSSDAPAEALARLAAAADAERAAAAITWLDHAASEPDRPVAVSSERPRRGRRPGARPSAPHASASA